MVVKKQQELKAIHRLLHQGRWLAGEGSSTQELFTYFDELDGLMGYIISYEGRDMSDFFEKELERVCLRFKATHILDSFKSV